jgi:hypothetical protein
LTKILRQLNDDKNWRLIIGKKNLDKHQRDVELVLRIFALTGKWESYEKPMKEYLNLAMRRNKAGDSRRVANFHELFPKLCALVVKQLGARPFHIRGPLNASVLDSVLVTLLDNFRAVPENLKERYNDMLKDTQYDSYTRTGTTDTTVVRNRLSEAKRYLIG